MIFNTLIFLCAIGLGAAQKSCPDEADGVYPLCRCKDFAFIFRDDVCVKVNRDVCPEPAYKTQYGCRCPDPKDAFDDYYWLCRTKLYLPTASPIHIITYETCPAFQRGIPPNCERIPCGFHQTGDFEPNCIFNFVPPVIVAPTKCPFDQVGTPPYCRPFCPRFQTRRLRYPNGTLVHPDEITFNLKFNSTIKFNVTCEPIPCPNLRGWTGTFMPNCTYTPFCPDGFPGNFPYCNKYAFNTTTLPTMPTKATKTTRTTKPYLSTLNDDLFSKKFTGTVSDQRSNFIDYRSNF